MFKCEKCGKTGPEATGQGWASVLADEAGARPKIICSRCADLFEQGWDQEWDPATKALRRFQRDFASVLSRI
jgi:hypothetical protein